MIITEHNFKTIKSARYYSLGEPTKIVKNIWMVFHGYGELAKNFIQNFNAIADIENLIIAPEAHNKFYLRGISENVGATWMTKDDRENEIEDYVKMIEEVFAQCTVNLNMSEVKLNVLGFSQGGSTAVRWLAKQRHLVHNIILWGAGLPKDVNYEQNLNYWNSTSLKLVVGSEDRYLNKNRLEEELIFLKTQKINHKLISYKGNHSIDEKTLIKIHKSTN